jgi:hypothetical protein
MKTSFLLMAQYDGVAVIPVEWICRDYFRHLTVEKFLRKQLAGEIDSPVVRMEGSRKLPKVFRWSISRPISTNKQTRRARNASS